MLCTVVESTAHEKHSAISDHTVGRPLDDGRCMILDLTAAVSSRSQKSAIGTMNARIGQTTAGSMVHSSFLILHSHSLVLHSHPLVLLLLLLAVVVLLARPRIGRFSLPAAVGRRVFPRAKAFGWFWPAGSDHVNVRRALDAKPDPEIPTQRRTCPP